MFCFPQGSFKIEPPDEYNYLVPRQVIKISPLHALSFYPTVQVAYEFKIIGRFTLQPEVGFVFNYGSYNLRYQNKRGAKLKMELRYYVRPNLLSNSINYCSLEPYGSFINFNRTETRTECFDLDCTILYSKKYFYPVKYRETGFSLKYGYVMYFQKFVLDYNFGLTVRFVNYIKPDLSIPGALNGFQESFFVNEQKRIGLAPIVGFRIGYCIK